jgi:glyoxylase-like metal-dependent hydrolase (beta-lactamase superfamily II)
MLRYVVCFLVLLFPLPAPAQAQPLVGESTTKVSDHVWAIMGFPNIAIIVGSRATLVTLRQPDIVFDKEAKLDLGGVTARLIWLGEGHTKGDELIFVEPDRTLISGDIVQNKVVPGIFREGGTPASWLAVLDRLVPLNALHVLPDHSAPGDGSLVGSELAFIGDVRTRALELKRRGVPAEDAGTQLLTEFKGKYPDWPNLNPIGSFVQRVYDEKQ